MWEFHGKNDDDQVKHLDLVLIDQKGTPMYAEVRVEAIPLLKTRLKEKKIYYMKKIIVDKAKPFFKPVRSPYMIKISKWTEVMEIQDEPVNFPKYTFFLTPFLELPKFETNNEYFFDVIGRVSALSDPTAVTTNTGIVRIKRLIHLVDLSGNRIEISLWGARAEEFEGDQVYHVGQENHVIIIFVGTTVKSYNGCTPFLSGTSACRWYINIGEIPEIASFYTSIPHPVYKIQKIDLQSTADLHNKIEQKTLLQLKSVDPFEDLKKRFECTITVIKLAEEPWCYPACPRCNSSTKYNGGIYTCKKEGIVCTEIIHRYKLCFIGTDGTWELQFMLFDERGTSFVGKPAEKLIKQYTKKDTPTEISALIGEKITTVVKVMPPRSDGDPDADPKFEILNIKKRHGKDLMACGFKKEQKQAIFNTSSSYSVNLPPLVPIESKIGEDQSSGSQLTSHDFQLMEVDQTNLLDDLSITHKREFQVVNDSDKDLSDDNEQYAPLSKKGRIKN